MAADLTRRGFAADPGALPRRTDGQTTSREGAGRSGVVAFAYRT